jgi:4-amino-4-deoxy-L-arabinose transferase-like glycosyltransferase
MFQTTQASQVGWLYPLAAVSIAVLLWQRRGKPRTDPIRAIVIMWTAWIVVYGLAYSEGSIHSYYVLTLAPALAALSGAGTVALWRAFRAGGRQALALPVTIGHHRRKHPEPRNGHHGPHRHPAEQAQPGKPARPRSRR